MRHVITEKSNKIIQAYSPTHASNVIVKDDFIIFVNKLDTHMRVQALFNLRDREIVNRFEENFFGAYFLMRTDLKLYHNAFNLCLFEFGPIYFPATAFNKNEELSLNLILKALCEFKKEILLNYVKKNNGFRTLRKHMENHIVRDAINKFLSEEFKDILLF